MILEKGMAAAVEIAVTAIKESSKKLSQQGYCPQGTILIGIPTLATKLQAHGKGSKDGLLR
jgi:hypothetical protein